MTTEELVSLVNTRLSKKLEERDKKSKKKSPKERLVEFWPGYRDAVLNYQAACIHSKGEFPEYLFKVLKPMHMKEEIEYLESTYQPITKDTFIEFSNTVKRCIPNGYIEFQTNSQEESENPLERYLFNNINNFNSITAWGTSMIDPKLIDANGIFAIWPEYSVDEEGFIVGETNPQPLIYNVPSILWKMDGEYIVQTNDGVMLDQDKVGIKLRYFGKNLVAELTQTGEYRDHKFELTRFFEHEIGYTPAQELKGIAVIKEDDVYYESVFNLAVPHLNLAIIDSVALLNIKQKVGYPTRVIMREKCQYVQPGGGICENGIIKQYNGDSVTTSNCPSCRGTGFLGVVGINSELVINSRPDGGLDNSTAVSAQNAMAYVGPSTEIPKFYRTEIEHEQNKAKEVLHLKAEPRQSGNITATEKNQDKQNTESFIKPISDQVWEIIGYCVECIGVMKFGKDEYEKLKPKVKAAQSFDLLGPDDYIAEMAEAKKSGAPEVVIQNIVYRYMQAVHHDDTISMKIFQLIEMSDRLLTMSAEQVAIGLSRGIISKWEAVLHNSSTYIVAKTIMDYQQTGRSFWDLSQGEQIDLVQQTAREQVPVDPNAELLPPPVEP